MPRSIDRLRFRDLVALPALVSVGLLGGCADSGFGRPSLISNAATIEVCCDDLDSLPAVVGDFEIVSFRAPTEGLIGAQTRFTILNDTAPVTLSMASGTTFVDQRSIDVSVNDCAFERVTVSFRLERTATDPATGAVDTLTQDFAFTVVNTCPPPLHTGINPLLIAETILRTPVPGGLFPFAETTPTGVETQNPNSSIPPEVPADGFVEIFETGSVSTSLAGGQIAIFNDVNEFGQSIDGLLIGGPSPLGFVATTPDPTNFGPGTALLAWICVAEPIPMTDAELGGRTLEYSLFLETNGNPADDFMAAAPFDAFARDGSDRSFNVVKRPGEPFVLEVRDGMDADLAPSATRAIVSPGGVFFVIPPSAIPGGLLPDTGRFQAFVHPNDFGVSGVDFSIDVEPPITEARRSFSRAATTF
jgi:hypothetical protein